MSFRVRVTMTGVDGSPYTYIVSPVDQAPTSSSPDDTRTTNRQDKMDCPHSPLKRYIVPVVCHACGKLLYEPETKRRRILPEEEEKAMEDETDVFYSSVFTMGSGETGQLGLGSDVMEEGRPTIVNCLPTDIIQIAAGGLHSVCLTDDGMVYTFGLNDEGTLGRITEEEEQCFLPASVGLNTRVIQVSAGDSHTTALTYNGRLFIWGTFRDTQGNTSLIDGGADKSYTPVEVMRGICVSKVLSGTDHILCLTSDALVYSFGNNEQGQLGRTSPMFNEEENEPPTLLKPDEVAFPIPFLRIVDIWTGCYSSFAKTSTGDIYAWGLNNYYQLGLGDSESRRIPEQWANVPEEIDCVQIAAGLHHTLALDTAGRVYSVGRGDFGQLGMGQIPPESEEEFSKTFSQIPKLQDIACASVACGLMVSFAVTRNGTAYCWGMGSEQLGLGGGWEDRNIYLPTPLGGELKTRDVLAISSGGQHTIILADEPMSKTWCDVEGHITREYM